MHEAFKRILVTTDFSEAGDHAIAHAFRMAADHGAEVLLCHVIEPVVVPNPLYAHAYPGELLSDEVRERVEEEVRKALRDRVPKDAAFGVSHTEEVTHGLPADEIIRLAEGRGIDLIVIATHGHTGLKHLLLGSVAERVIRYVRCPVLVVR